MFSHEKLEFSDLCETKSVTSALYLDFNENLSDLPFDEDGNPTPDDHPSRHDYRFVGKVGSFCPIKPGCGGGILLREKDGKYHAATGTKKRGKVERGEAEEYRWMEAEMVKTAGYEDNIDMGYFRDLADAAIDTINKFGNFERFASEEEYVDLGWKNIPALDDDEELPFDPDPREKFMNLPVAA